MNKIMLSNIEKYKEGINKLIEDGESILLQMDSDDAFTDLKEDYEIWYSEALAIIKVILPDRTSDFVKIYYDEKEKKGLKTYFQFIPPTVIKGLIGFNLDFPGDTIIQPKNIEIAKSIFGSQIGILKACEKRFESSLYDIKYLLQADLFKSELEAASELNKKGFTRGAGAIAGVVLESHLLQVCKNHNIKVGKNDPSINDLNDVLKKSNIIEIDTWRNIQILADRRNLCDHKKNKEPTKQQIDELIIGVDKICKTLF